MKLFTKDIDKKLFAQYPKGSDIDSQVAVAKIFNPYGRGRWFLLNSDPQDPDYVWAIVQMGDIVEMGSVLRSELESIRVSPFRLPLERDLGFRMVNAGELYRGLLQGKFYKKGGWVDGYAGGGMIPGRYYKDNTGNELRYIGESDGELIFKDGEKVVKKSEDDFGGEKETKLFKWFKDGGFVEKTDEELKGMNDDELFEYLDAKAAYMKQYARPLSSFKAKNFAANAAAVQFQNEGTSKLDANFPNLSKINQQATKDYEETIAKRKNKMAMGGKVTFNDKVKAIQKKLLANKKVPKAVQKDYGKTYDKAEAKESAQRIVGAQTAKWKERNKMKKGGTLQDEYDKLKFIEKNARNSYYRARDLDKWYSTVGNNYALKWDKQVAKLKKKDGFEPKYNFGDVIA